MNTRRIFKLRAKKKQVLFLSTLYVKTSKKIKDCYLSCNSKAADGLITMKKKKIHQ